MVGSSYTSATANFSALNLRYSDIVAASVGNSATDSRVRRCYTQVDPAAVNCETTNTKTFTALNASKDGTAQSLPAFITFTPNTTLGNNGNRISLSNITKAHIGTWTLSLVETNSFGTTPLTTTSLTIVVDCTIASIADLALTTTPFNASKEITYTLYSGTL